MPKSNAVKRYVIGYDLHYPLYSKATFNAMLEVIKDIKPDGFVFGGDQQDNLEISHHTKGKPLFRERAAFKRNTDGFDKDILIPLEAALPKNAEKIYILGNHERFETDFIEEHPELEGVIERIDALRLKQRGWEIVPLGHAKVIGELTIIHGEVLSGVGNQGSAYPAKKALDIYGTNVLAGHSHSPQTMTKISPVDIKKKHMATIAPTLGETNPVYLRNRPTSWLTGFCVLELRAKGLFNLYTVVVIDGECSYGGKLYGG